MYLNDGVVFHDETIRDLLRDLYPRLAMRKLIEIGDKPINSKRKREIKGSNEYGRRKDGLSSRKEESRSICEVFERHERRK